MSDIPTRNIIGAGRQIMARGGRVAQPQYFPNVPDNIRNNPEGLQSWYVDIAQNPEKYIPENIKNKNEAYAKKLAGQFKRYASLKAGREWTGRTQDASQTSNAADAIQQETEKIEPWVKTIDTVAGLVTFDAHKNLIKAGEYIYEGQYAKALFEALKAGGKIVASALLIAGTGGAGQAAKQPIVMIGSRVFKAAGGGKNKVLKYMGEVGKQFEKVVEKGKSFLKPKGGNVKDAYGGMSREKWLQQTTQHMHPKGGTPSLQAPPAKPMPKPKPPAVGTKPPTTHQKPPIAEDTGGISPKGPDEPGGHIDITW